MVSVISSALCVGEMETKMKFRLIGKFKAQIGGAQVFFLMRTK
jgi:hypothetical protein